ncbi:hypothetical protein [Achromobacter sp. AONIH1]|uniref:hypothetical protein n=1 Tax=Achromobacter sp. AONIH1 TaxID=1758194 RepID=UPI001319EFF1|nr:hypothetical protein [Achromobacter sp. AONIH1]
MNKRRGKKDSKKQFLAIMPNDDVVVISGKGRQSACMKITGRRVAQSLELGLLKSIEEKKAAQNGTKAR